MESAISALPKYRVSEIHKRINPEQPEGATDLPTSDKQAQHANTVQPNKKTKADSAIAVAENATAASALEEGENNGKPKFSKSLTQKINSAK